MHEDDDLRGRDSERMDAQSELEYRGRVSRGHIYIRKFTQITLCMESEPLLQVPVWPIIHAIRAVSAALSLLVYPHLFAGHYRA